MVERRAKIIGHPLITGREGIFRELGRKKGDGEDKIRIISINDYEYGLNIKMDRGDELRRTSLLTDLRGPH